MNTKTKMASKAASNMASGASNMASGILKPSKYSKTPVLTEPLLPKKKSQTTDSINSDDDDSSSSSSGRESTISVKSDNRILVEEMSQSDKLSTVGAALMAVAGMAASVAAMVAVPGGAVIVMGLICLVNSPVVGSKQLTIVKSTGIRGSVNAIRDEIKFLKTEVDFVEKSVNDLEAEVNALRGVEESLAEIAQQQNTNVEQLVNIVNENQSILNEMKTNLKQTFVAAVASIVIQSDVDGNMKIDLKELAILTLRLQAHLEPLGLELDTHKFEAMIKEDNDISTVLRFCSEVFYEGDVDDDEASVGSDVTFDFETFCNSLDDDQSHLKMSRSEKLSMIRINDRFTQGSVETARGHRATLSKAKSKGEVRRDSYFKEVSKHQHIIETHHVEKQVEERRRRQTRITLGGLVIIRGTSAEV
mmetsp:Transcript_19934/g.43336  ORF Transcript_19934/g.43336 Transcript_19934/m.43336 type:complete len:418 (-) Transcript_19934:174-1427(-)